MKELKEMIAQAEMTGKDFADNLKYAVDVDGMSGSEVTEMVNDQTGLNLSKEDVYSFILEYRKNSEGNAFSEGKMNLWRK